MRIYNNAMKATDRIFLSFCHILILNDEVKRVKKDKFVNMEAAEANIDLNKVMNEENKIIYKKGARSSTEANIAMQEDFYSDNEPKEVTPTYITNGTQATFIDKDD